MSVNINLSPEGPKRLQITWPTKVLEGTIGQVEGTGVFPAWEEDVS